MTGVSDERGQRQVTWSAYPPDGARGESVRCDLRRAARMFGTQAVTLRSIMPAGAPASVDGGLPEFDQALTQALELIGGLHARLAVAIAQHGSNLQQATEGAPEWS